MRILHVYAGPFPTHQGTQVYLRGLLGAQAALGHAVHLRCWADGDGTPVPGVHLRRLPRLPGATRRSGPSWGRLPRGPALVAALRSDLREGWDRIHAHHVEATLAARSLGAGPLVVHPHTALAWELPTFVSRGRRLAARAGRLLDRRVARAGEVAVALSPAGAARLRADGAQRVLTLPPAVDVGSLGGDAHRARRRWDLGAGPWVLYVGNTDGYQDLPDLATAVIRHRLPLLVVTADPLGPLRRLLAPVPATRLRLVRTAGFAAVRDAMAAATVGAIPRRICAGFPMKLLNLLGAGRAVVGTTGLPPHPGLVRVPPGDPDALGRALRARLDDPSGSQALGAAGRHHLRARGGWEALARALDRACHPSAMA